MNQLQIRASNPEIAAWVSASAGTGKTKILTDRVIRLLLKGIEPGKILCLTFTNAAASEMQERIRTKLEQLAKASPEQLITDLTHITGERPGPKELEKVKYLYDDYLKKSDQINIHTLHSYCQKILQKFPIEAGVTPNFQILDELDQQAATGHIKKMMMVDQDFVSINSFLAENFHQTTIDEIFADILRSRTKFSVGKPFDKDFEGLIDILAKGASHQYAPFLQYPLINKLIDANPSISQLKSFFLNKDGSIKKRIATAKIAKPGSNTYDELLTLQAKIYELDQKEREHHIEYFSKILQLLAHKFLQHYEEYKRKKGLLDYDDLIIKTRALLCDKSARDWVLYKLDGGIDHILVDEAQDTSPEQWQIIESLIQEFFAGEGRNQVERTIFVVGDEKQSIFSFQGADVESFTQMNQLLTKKLRQSNSNFENINLDVSYRSAEEILDVVYDVFSRVKQKLPKSIFSDIPPIKAHRSSHPGQVELWPLIREDDKEDDFWPITTENSNKSSAKNRLAKQIAEYIKQELGSGKVLPATGKVISPADFMILFRTRNDFTLEVIQEIKNLNLPVSGLDRIILADDILVKDLIAAAKFVLNPLDELNLAALLKSPFIGLDDDQLRDVILSDPTLPLCDKLEHQVLHELKMIYQQTSVADFFHAICHRYNIRTLAYTEYGYDSLESIDELLKLTTKYSAANDHSLQGFITWFEASQTEIKRETDSLNVIKIMTVHGSKGLQAPYVILCDTTTAPANTDRFIWCKDRGMLSFQAASMIPESFAALKDAVKQKEFEEYLRLLYVGMTRAEDNLIICGYAGKNKIPENCWYELIFASMNNLGLLQEDGALIYENGQKQYTCLTKESHLIEPKNILYIKPLNFQSDGISIAENKITNNYTSPLLTNDSVEYGLVFHKILEDSVKLGSISEMQWHPLIATLDQPQQARLLKSINLLCANEDFTRLLTKNIKTELPIGTNNNGQYNIGRIDLLIQDGNIMKIIDYKSDLRPPLNKSEVKEGYLNQLAFYQKTLAKIYPHHTIETYILWLENGQLMAV